MRAVLTRGLGLALVLAALSGSAWAVPDPVPELDPGSVAGAMTLLSCGLLLVTRRRSK
jgi:hypothetical protein